MRRTLLLLSFLALFAGSAFAENQKLDKDLNDKVSKGNRTEKVRVIIQHFSPVSASDKDNIKKNGGNITHELPLINAHAVEISVALLELLAKHANVKHISLDQPVKAHAGEPYAVSGAALANQTYGVTGNGIGVAVIDSGIAVHPDLTVAKAHDFIDTTHSGGYDPFGHGTHVAGILAGSGAASNGMHKGMAPNVNLVDLRVLDATGKGYTSDVINAINWAVANANTPGNNGKNLNIRVINLSLGHAPTESADLDPLDQAARAAVKSGMVVVASAGNHGKDSLGNVLYESVTVPGNEPSVITVGAMNTWGTDSRTDDTVATYSSRGPTYLDHRLKPDIVAPGQRVPAAMSPGSYFATTYPQLITDGSYIALSGTSMATPVVAGSVALVLEKNPNMTPNAVKAALMFTAEPENNVPYPVLTVGAGYLNTAGAVNLAANINTAAPQAQNWIMNGGVGLNYNNVIGGNPAIWHQVINWATKQRSNNAIFYNTGLWGQTVVWDDTIVWDSTIVWGDTIVWDSAILAAQTIVWDSTVVWDETIIWDSAY